MTEAAERKHAVIYCRVSGKKQATDGHGLGSQETRCRDYAREKGYTVAAVFTDDVSGGGDFMKRPGMVKLLRYLDDNPERPHVVIFDDLKRYARDTVFHLKLRQEMALRNAERECLNFRFEDSPEGEFIETVIAAQSQLERQQNSRQVRQKMRARVQNGFWVFRAPVGYRYEKSKAGGKVLVPDEEAAPIIREVLEGFASGRFASQMEIKRYLDCFPGMLYQASEAVHKQRIREILECPLYAGYIEAPKWGIALMKGRHEPLISYETHQRVLARLHRPEGTFVRQDMREDFPLRGLVTCASCERPMTAAWSKGRHCKYPYYFCQTKGCIHAGKSMRKEKIEGEFEALLDHLRPTEEIMAMLRAMVREASDERERSHAGQAASLKAELTEVERRKAQFMERLLATTEAALIPIYEEQVRDLHARKIGLEEKLSAAPRPLADFSARYRTAFAFVANPRKIWDFGDIKRRRLVPKLLFGGRLPYERNVGYRTGGIAHPFRTLRLIQSGESGMVPQEGLAIRVPKPLSNHENIQPYRQFVYQCRGTVSSGLGAAFAVQLPGPTPANSAPLGARPSASTEEDRYQIATRSPGA